MSTQCRSIFIALFAVITGCGAADAADDSAGGTTGAADSSGDSTGGSTDDGTDDGVEACNEDSPFGEVLRDCDLPGACGACLWEKACASFLFRCARNADCVCAAECVGQQSTLNWESCLSDCGLTEPPPGFAEWLKGASDMCYDEGCGLLDDPPIDPDDPSGAGGSGTEVDCGFDPDLAYDPCGSVLQLQSENGDICARIERRDDGPGSDANEAFTLLDARIGPLGQVCHASEPGDFCWFASHHNYSDWLHIDCGGIHDDLNVGQGCGPEQEFEPYYRLHAYEEAPSGGECSPSADGSCPAIAAVDLVPF